MIIHVCAFTSQGQNLIEKLNKNLPDITWLRREEGQDLKAWTGEVFAKRLPLLYIGATGIAIRTISDFVSDKISDSPVLIMDEKGEFVIPLLSGHLGGANDLTKEIAEAMGATPVITTATDVEGLFAVDVFAKKNGLHIVNREGIRLVSTKLLRGQKVTMTVDHTVRVSEELLKNLPAEIEFLGAIGDEKVDIWIGQEEREALINLKPKNYGLGIGCKKGKSFAELKTFVDKCLLEAKIGIDEVYAIGSIDLKKDEIGLMTLAQFYHLPFVTFSSEELAQVEGAFTPSEFVKETTGVANVCERSAVALTRGELLVKKTAENGMTFALAQRVPQLMTWK